MVATTLTKEMIESGRTLVRKLDEQGLHPDAAFWLYSSDLQEWKLVIAEVKLDTEGPRKIYKKIQDVISVSKEDMPEISLDSVTLAKPDAPIVHLLKRVIHTGPGISEIRFTTNVINGTLIEDAYIYRVN
ncbi:MAG TPA: hypothetical protein VEF34_17540 [Syntrophobacteraceae bacterium]|nr:hypothetical protein [Syntrophobacteraceae bacterium]